MERSAPTGSGEFTPIGRALLILGDQWTLLILQRAFFRVRRFTDWQSELGVSPAVLATRLRELVGRGILTTNPYYDELTSRTLQEYRLTDRGVAMWPITLAVWSWERHWGEHSGPLPRMIHLACGRNADVSMCCRRCGKVVSARDTRVDHVPEGPFTRSAPPRPHRRATQDQLPQDGLSRFPEVMEILGDRWNTSVLAAVFLGTRRFAELERRLAISSTLLSARLRRLAELGVLQSVSSSDPSDRPDYRLTDKGMAFFPVFALLIDWAQRWLAGPPESQLVITHRDCRRRLVPELCCTICGDVIDRRDVSWLS